MKTKLILACLLAFTGNLLAQTAEPEKLISSYRVRPKPGKDSELEKALIAHAEQFHKGDFSWRIFRVMTGDDSGMLHITEGMMTFASLEDRGDLGAAHTADYTKNITPLIAATGPERLARVMTEHSTTQPASPSKKVLMRYFYAKPGQVGNVLKQIKLFKPVWEKLGYEVVVYQTYFSGEARVATARRLKNGFKDVDPNGTKKFADTFDAIHGTGAYEKLLTTLGGLVSRTDETILEAVATPNRS